MNKVMSGFASLVIALVGMIVSSQAAQADVLQCSAEQISWDGTKALKPHEVPDFSRAGCSLVGKRVQLPSGQVATVPMPGITIVGSNFIEDSHKEVPETYSMMSPAGQLAFAERYSSGITNFVGDQTVQDQLKATIGKKEGKLTPSMLAWASQKCTYSTVNVNLAGWPNGITYDWWLTDTATYPPVSGQADLTVWNIEAGSKAWQNRKTTCAGSYPAHKAAANYKGTTSRVAGIAADTSCQVAPDWTSVVTFKSLAAAPQGTLASACWYYGVSGGLWEADIAFNKDYSWAMNDNGFLSCNPGQYILEGVAAHEFGHALGLAHAPQASEQVMRPQTASCTRTDTQLGAGDLASIYHFYHY